MSYTFEEKYLALKEYALKYGTTRLTQFEKYGEYPLGNFVAKCRTRYNNGTLPAEQYEMLKEIGFCFNPYEEDWNKFFSIACEYNNEFGNLLVPERYVYKGVNLGTWISKQRTEHKNNSIRQDRKLRLESIGMVWNANDASWDYYYNYAKKYYEEFGNLDVPVKYEFEEVKLGRWISNQRTAYNVENDSHILSEERIKKLNEIGMIWEYVNTKQASFPEKAMFYYFRKIFPNAIANDRRFGCEVDALDIEARVGIEYDGEYYHQNIERDMNNNAKICPYIKLYRLREIGCPQLVDGLSQNIIVEKKDNYIYLSGVLQELFNIVCDEYEKPLIDVDIYRDLDQILKLYKGDTDRFEFWFKEAKKYYDIHGDLLVVVKDERSKSLYNFIGRCRAAYSGRKGKISANQIKRLNELNMVWNVPDEQFEKKMNILRKYAHQYGSIKNIKRGTQYEGINLDSFLQVLRNSYKNNRLEDSIADELELLGIVWYRKNAQWMTYYSLLKRIYDREGSIEIVNSTYVEDGLKIGQWLHHQILAYWKIERRTITGDRIKLLEELNIDWQAEKYENGIDFYFEKRWMDLFYLTEEYISIYGNKELKTNTVYKGEKIGKWISRQLANDLLPTKKKNLIKEIDFRTNKDTEWMEMFGLVKEFSILYGWDELQEKTIYKDKPIGRWVDTRRQERKRNINNLTQEKIDLLDSIGMIWDIYLYNWNRHYEALSDWLKNNSWKNLTCHVNHNGFDIGRWVIRQRMIHNGTAKTGKLSDEQIKLLEELGIVWDVNDYRWKEKYKLLSEYVTLYGWESLTAKTKYKGERIGDWVVKMRGARKGKCGRLTISQEHIELLNQINMPW